MKVRRIGEILDAVQWFQNGDHPDDGDGVFPAAGALGTDARYTGEFAGQRLEGKVVRYFRHPAIDGEQSCGLCGTRFHEHGWIDYPQNLTVCPGDWIVTVTPGSYQVLRPAEFRARYEPVPEPPVAPLVSPAPNSEVARLAAMRKKSQDAVARDVAHRRRERTLCTEIAADMAADATALDGKPFNGNTIAHAFGTQGAAIAALAGVVERLLERLDSRRRRADDEKAEQ